MIRSRSAAFNGHISPTIGSATPLHVPSCPNHVDATASPDDDGMKGPPPTFIPGVSSPGPFARYVGGGRLGRFFFYIIISSFTIYIALFLLSPGPFVDHKESAHLATRDQITVVINTFKRYDMMQDAVEYYASCGLTKYIHVIWSDSKPPPQRITAKFANFHHPKIVISQQLTVSLNNRFKPLEGPHTDCIFAVDDDMRVPCEDLEMAYEVWRGSPTSLVGFMPRIHLRGKNDKLIYRCWWRVWWHGAYSIILTKAAFLHKKYLDMYTYEMPSKIRDLVDRDRNCEDIAMQFLIANATSLPPIYVKGHVDDLGALNGISTSKSIAKAGHMDKRSQCLNDLVEIFGRLPLVTSHHIVDSARNGWTNVPSTWYEYISSDLWKWND